MDSCVFCEMPIKKSVGKDLVTNISCNNCGNYKIAYQAINIIPNELKDNYNDKRHIISGFIREMTDNDLHLDTINVNNFRNLINNDTLPKTVLEKADKLLLYIFRKSRHMFDEINVPSDQPAIAYSRSEDEFANNFELLREFGYINYSKVTVFAEDDSEKIAFRCSLTLEGLKRGELIQKHVGTIEQCFVAMWHEESMLNIYDNYITTAIIECGYSPVIIPDKESNDDTFDEMIVEIRKSKFVIIDLTGHKHGPYYVGGFAYGLGKEVIFTCREDNLNDICFNINHNNIIAWQDGNDLYAKLKNRILAVLGVKTK